MENKIKKKMASVFGIKASKIDKNTSPDIVREWDSLKHMILISVFEEEFNIKFTGDEIIEIVSFPLIKIVIEEKLKK